VTDHPIRVVAAVVARDDRLLVCQRPLHKRHGGLWEFPGGKCEAAESDADAIRRELREELGVEASIVGGEECAIADDGSPFLIVFVRTTIVGEPACREHAGLMWGTLDELATLPLAPSDRRFVEHRLRHASR
jgi:mutator protein MutT